MNKKITQIINQLRNNIKNNSNLVHTRKPNNLVQIIKYYNTNPNSNNLPIHFK